MALTMTNSDEMLTRYLFGELPESEQSRLEERYFTDAEIFDRLVQLETEMVDSYTRGQLSPELRNRFERAYLTDSNRRARLRFSEALVAKLDQNAVSSLIDRPPVQSPHWWQRVFLSGTGTQRTLAFSMAFAILFVSLLTLWLWIQNNRLRQDLASIQSHQAILEQRARETEQRLADERTRTEQLNAELERARSEAAPQLQTPPEHTSSTIASLVLVVSGVRGTETGAAPKLIIKKETEEVRLQLKLKENEYKNYNLVLQRVGGNEIYNRKHLKPRTAKSGTSLNVTIPASKIATGDYILTLRGLTANGNVEDVSQSLFRVESGQTKPQ
jgi:hypothetical protein